MSNEAVIQRAFEIEAGSEPITGRITVAGEPPREFVGWFQLFAVIEELRGSPAASDGGAVRGQPSRSTSRNEEGS